MNQTKISYIIVSALTLFGMNAGSYAYVEDKRCITWGDSLEQGASTDIRYQYAMRCPTNIKLQGEIILAYEQGIRHEGGTAATATKGYPIYGVFAPDSPRDIAPYKNPAKWFAPMDAKRANEACDSITSGDGLKPKNYEVFAVCASGCYTPDQALLVNPYSIETKSAIELYESKTKNLVAITEASTLTNIGLKQVEINDWITDLTDANQKILHFKTLSGGVLKVTENHPIINARGEVEEAALFKVGDALVKVSGKLDPIIEIIHEDYFGKVYNFDSEAKSDTDRIFVAQGFLNASVHFQNKDVAKLNRLILRSTIAENLVNKYTQNN